MALFISLNTDQVLPDISRPTPEKVMEGDPVHTTWNIEERDDALYAGIWQSTPGTWRISYDEWEFCHILSGISVISEDGGEARTVSAGDSFILRPGFKGTWQVIETTMKEYIIKL